TRDHSRRTRRVLDRAMKGHLTRVVVHPSPYSSFDPDRWWQTRSSIRTEIVELQNLVLEIVLHAFSFSRSRLYSGRSLQGGGKRPGSPEWGRSTSSRPDST